MSDSVKIRVSVPYVVHVTKTVEVPLVDPDCMGEGPRNPENKFDLENLYESAIEMATADMQLKTAACGGFVCMDGSPIDFKGLSLSIGEGSAEGLTIGPIEVELLG